MPKTGSFIGMAILGALVGCNPLREPPRGKLEYPKAPLQVMAPIITPEPTTAMSRLAHLNRPQVVLIPAESTAVVPGKM